ncbi:hypothetical protein P3712_26990, partial [Vibrio parahaemolyticus]|nr:hypothetical protein [Vibrio parahaemolyticus]
IRVPGKIRLSDFARCTYVTSEARQFFSSQNVRCEHSSFITLSPHTPIKFTQRPSLFARFALQNWERHFANFSDAHALARLELRLT